MTTLTINIDEHLKADVQKRTHKEGLTLTALISRFFKSYLNNEFEMRLVPNDKVLRAHKQALKELENGTAKLYNSAEEMIEDIMKEDESKLNEEIKAWDSLSDEALTNFEKTIK